MTGLLPLFTTYLIYPLMGLIMMLVAGQVSGWQDSWGRALKQAAINGTPFCEECEKRKSQKAPKIIDIYWMDENQVPRTAKYDDIIKSSEKNAAELKVLIC